MTDVPTASLADIKKKYREERDRRLRADGEDQFVAIEATSDFDVDPT